MKQLFKFHGVPKKTISNQDHKFTANFWKELFDSFRKKLAFVAPYHPQTNDQMERINIIFNDMHIICVMHHAQK